MEERLLDLDELVLRCRNDRAKAYIAEAVACYRSGAFRACIVTTWVAVAYDFLEKLDELALTGDKEAETRRTEFEKSRQAQDTSSSLRFEREILDLAKDKFEFISPVEYEDLQRLFYDRNRCAHPSMNAYDEIYQPTAELARYHLRNTVTHLLQHQPVQGKAALERLKREVTSLYFPSNPQDALVFFQQGPLLRPRDALVRNFIAIIIKDLLNLDMDDSSFLRYASALNAVRMMHRLVAEKYIEQNLSNITRSLDDNRLPNVIRFLMHIPDVWQYLSVDVRKRADNFTDAIDISKYGSLFVWLLEFEPLRDKAQQRINKFSDNEIIDMIKARPSPALADRALDIYSSSQSFAHANTLANNIVLPLVPVFTTQHVVRILEIASSNEEVRSSFQLVDILESILSKKSLTKDYINTIILAISEINIYILQNLINFLDNNLVNELIERGVKKWDIKVVLDAMKGKRLTTDDYVSFMKRIGLEDEIDDDWG